MKKQLYKLYLHDTHRYLGVGLRDAIKNQSDYVKCICILIVLHVYIYKIEAITFNARSSPVKSD